MDGVVKVAGNGLAASRVAGEKDITSHIALVAVNVILHSDILHIKHLLIWFCFYIILQNSEICKQ